MDASGKEHNGQFDGIHHHWWDDEDVQRARLRSQVDYILQELPGAAAAWSPEDAGRLEYLYRAGRILVRDADLDRVLGLVDGEVADALINGVTAVTVADTQAALSTIDTQLGVGVATPDHVLYVNPASCCPATEPEPVAQANPDPAVRRDCCSDGTGAFVSIVDTGFIPTLDNARHPWLEGVVGVPEVYDPADIGLYVGHGSFVTGVLRCMAPRAQVRVEALLTRGGADFESDIVRQLHKALDWAPDIISVSAGCTTRAQLGLLTFQALWEGRLKYCKGTVLVAAAGNDASRCPFFPAGFEWAVSVGALNRDGSRAPFSNYGSWVDVYAVGVDIVNAFPNGQYRYQEPPNEHRIANFVNEMASWSGTSFATPLVAGMIAARMSRTGQSGRQAADSMLRVARSHARPGVGAIADPCMIDDLDPRGVS